MTASQGALEGIRVLDLTRYIPGPYCTMLLGDLGADIIKIEEPPIGDPTRATPPAVDSDSAVHAALNRNKRSVVLDLRKEAGAAAVRRLAARCDVLVDAFRPGVLARRGLGFEALSAENPRLIYCAITGYGQDGPLAARAGHDINYIARAGLLGTNLDGDGRPLIPVLQLADMTGGLLGALGILAALQARERTGRGQMVDVSMLEGILALMTVPATRFLAGAGAAGPLAGSHACYNVFRCRDGRYISAGGLEPKFWRSLCLALGLSEFVPRQWEGGATQRETLEALRRVFATRDRDDWIRELESADACIEPVLDLDEALDQPQVRVRGARIEQPAGETALRTVASPIRLTATPAATRRPPPVLGEHGAEVLAEVGYDGDEIGRLRKDGVLR